MRAPLRYGAAGVVAVALVTGALWPFLDAPDRRGVLVAAAIALPIQFGAFWLLHRLRSRVNGFLAVWAGGTLFRMLVVALVAVVAIRSQAPGTVALLLALAGFFFGLLLLEPVYFRRGHEETA